MTSDSSRAGNDNEEELLAHPSLRDPARRVRYRQAREKYIDEVLHPPDRRGLE